MHIQEERPPKIAKKEENGTAENGLAEDKPKPAKEETKAQEKIEDEPMEVDAAIEKVEKVKGNNFVLL